MILYNEFQLAKATPVDLFYWLASLKSEINSWIQQAGLVTADSTQWHDNLGSNDLELRKKEQSWKKGS